MFNKKKINFNNHIIRLIKKKYKKPYLTLYNKNIRLPIALKNIKTLSIYNGRNKKKINTNPFFFKYNIGEYIQTRKAFSYKSKT